MNLGLKKRVKAVPNKTSSVLPIGDLVPNTWNHNVMEPAEYKKLKAMIQHSYEETGKLATPIVVRTHPTQQGKWEIIDGAHRWKACGELGRTEVDVWIYDPCSDKMARFLTDMLNYLRGAPNPEKQVEFYKELGEMGVSKDEMAKFTSITREELDELIEANDIDIESVDVTVPGEEDDEEEEKKATDWLELKFLVPKEAAEVVEAELARIGDTLEGKNVRGRALEFMAVQSAQTPLEDVKPPTTKKKLEIVGGKKRKKAS